MGLEMAPVEAEPAERSREQQVVEIYPLSRYYFGAKDGRPAVVGETAADRVLRLKANFVAHGLRTCVHVILVVELSGHPHLLLLQVRNSSFLLPGGRLRPAEQDVQGLKRKLSSKLSAADRSEDHDWQIGECIGMWWRSDFEARPFPYLPPAPKECMKLFLVRLPMCRQFIVPRNLKLLAVPLSQIHDNAQAEEIKQKINITHRFFCVDVAGEEAASDTRRRRCFLETLEQKHPPGGREVSETRTSRGLQPAPSPSSLAPSAPATKRSTRSTASRSGGGNSAHGDPRGPRARRRGRRSAMDLRGAPLPEGTNAARKHTADEASASKTPPAEAQLLPTLCTRRDPAIPQPPAAEAAGGGEESRGSAAARWEQTGGAQIASLFLRERGTSPRSVFLELG